MHDPEMTSERPVRRVTVLALSALGELVMTLPLLGETRRLYPNARLTLICERPAVAELAESLRVVDDVIRLPCHARRRPAALAHSCWHLRRLKTDLAIQPFTSHGSFGNLLIAALQAPISCGYAEGRFQGRLTHRLPIPQNRHHIEMNLDLLRRLGHQDVREPEGPFLPMRDAEWENSTSQKLKRQRERYVLLAVGSDAKLAFKRWDNGKWAALCARLTAQGVTCLFTGVEDDRETIDDIRQKAGGQGCNFAGKTGIQELVMLLRGCEMVIGTDGMTLHLAAATNTPCVGIFGPTDPLHVGPWGNGHKIVRLRLPCMPCYGPNTVGKTIPCQTRECLRHLPVDMVYEAALAILSERKPLALAGAALFADTTPRSNRG